MTKINRFLLPVSAILLLCVAGCEKNSSPNAASNPAKDANVSTAANSTPTATPIASNSDSGTEENAAGVTSANFDKLSKGMTVAEIKKIIGSEGKLLSEGGNPGYKMSMYQWKDGKNNISCMFQNDKMISKTQFGL